MAISNEFKTDKCQQYQLRHGVVEYYRNTVQVLLPVLTIMALRLFLTPAINNAG